MDAAQLLSGELGELPFDLVESAFYNGMNFSSK
jgi:hypothetical protein